MFLIVEILLANNEKVFSVLEAKAKANQMKKKLKI